MGQKVIWDGDDLPEIGSEVLIHLSSLKTWVRHVVKGYKVTVDRDNTPLCRVQIMLGSSDDPRSSDNARLFPEILPGDSIDRVMFYHLEVLKDLREKLNRQQEELFEMKDKLSKKNTRKTA